MRSSTLSQSKPRGARPPLLRVVLCLLPSLGSLFLPIVASATVFFARDEALEMAFPSADLVSPSDYYLTTEQRISIEKLARSPLESDLITVYSARKDGKVMAYGILDTHLVRTLPETFLIVWKPDGTLIATHLIAFHEPSDYQPSDRWLAQFADKRLTDELQIGRGIAAITGSSLTSRAVTDSIRRALAIHAVLLSGAKD